MANDPSEARPPSKPKKSKEQQPKKKRQKEQKKRVEDLMRFPRNSGASKGQVILMATKSSN